MDMRPLLIAVLAVFLAYGISEAGEIPDFVGPLPLTIDASPASDTAIQENVPKSLKYELKGDVVIDQKQRIGWMRTSSEKKYSWKYASGYCNELVYGGHSDWFLPFVNQLAKLIDRKYHPTIEPIFQAHEKSYWTKDESGDSSGNTIYMSAVSFRKGRVVSNPAGGRLYVRCARVLR